MPATTAATDGDGVSDEHLRECDHNDCMTDEVKWKMYAGFCSDDCRHRAKGQEVLETIKHDQRLCSTCFRPVRNIEKPSSDWIERTGSHIETAMQAGAELTSTTQEYASDFGGVKLHTELDYTSVQGGMRKVNAESIIGNQYMTEHTVRTPWGWSCECGNTDHTHRESAIIDVEIEQVIVFLYRALQQLFDEGHISQSPSRQELFAGLREHWKDWEYAIGRCLHK